MAGLYDFNFREQNKIPAPVGNKGLYQLNKPVDDYTRIVNPTLNPVEAVSQKTKNDIQKASDAQIAADQKILDQRNNMRALKEMESIGQGHPFTPQTPTSAQGYATAEDLSLAANSIDTDLDKKMTSQRGFTNLLLNKPTPLVSLSDAKNTPAPVETTAPQTPTVPRGLLLTPSQEKPYLAIQQSILDNPDDPTKWGQPGIVARETDSGTQMPNGWGVVKDSKGRVHIAPPTRWNFYGDTQAEQKWKAQQRALEKEEAKHKGFLRAQALANAPFASRKDQGNALDYLAIQASENNRANAASLAGLNAALNRQAALDKEARGNKLNVFKDTEEIVKGYYQKTGNKEKDEANASAAAEIMARLHNDPSALVGIDGLNPAQLKQRAGQLAIQGKLDHDVRRSNDSRVGLRGVVDDWSLLHPTSWFGINPFAGGEMVDMSGMDIEQQQILKAAAIYNKYFRDQVDSGRLSEAQALQLLNARLIENKLPPLQLLPRVAG